jgi:hypothetical protein
LDKGLHAGCLSVEEFEVDENALDVDGDELDLDLDTLAGVELRRVPDQLVSVDKLES